MKLIIKDESREDVEIEQKNITIRLNKDVDFRIEVNNFGELEITKANFGSGSGSINIEPCVSNNIRLK